MDSDRWGEDHPRDCRVYGDIMANYWCYVDERPRSFCPKNGSGECINVAHQAALTQADRASGDYDTPTFGIMPDGNHPEALDKKLEIRFDKDMHAYREARRGGEQPDQVSQKAVFKQQRIVEQEARVQERIDRG